MIDLPNTDLPNGGYVGVASHVPGGNSYGLQLYSAALGGSHATPSLPATAPLTATLTGSLLLAVREGGKAGLITGTLLTSGALTLPTTPHALIGVSAAQGELRQVTPARFLSGRQGNAATLSGTAGGGPLLGFAELGRDPALGLWTYIHEGDAVRGVTTVTTAGGGTLSMPSPVSLGYALQSRMAFDPAADVTLEFRATFEQLSGTKGWLGRRAVLLGVQLRRGERYAGDQHVARRPERLAVR